MMAYAPMLEVFRQDYMTARAKGLRTGGCNQTRSAESLIPIVTLVGAHITALFLGH
jgi:ABC-type dipeptide/oligopeptide/nickel transport system permease component